MHNTLTSLPKLIAHRGYASAFPENTLLAIREAVAAGAQYIEFDILLSADRVPVLFHDRDLQRMCGHPAAVHELSFSELASLAVYEPQKFGQRFVANRISRLSDVLSYLQTQNGVTAFVELKRQALDVYGIDIVLEQVLPQLERHAGTCVVISYSYEALLAVRQRSPLAVGAVFDDWLMRDNQQLTQLQAEYWFTDIDRLPAELSECPATLAVYECTDPQQAIRVHQRGVDMVETFDIRRMRDAFAESGAKHQDGSGTTP